tara:strand:- start:1539 stop:2063 length:525 start_codon:yes stop_codon:yes gene_type:complete
MKYLVKFVVVTFFVLVCTTSFAEQKIVFVDMTFVLNNSKAGKGAQDYLKKAISDNQKRFSDTEKKLKNEEADLIGKKNDMSKEEYKKYTDALRAKVIEYQKERKEVFDKITKQRAEARKKLLEKVTPIMENYADENNISLVIDKKSLIITTPATDITNIIVEKLNTELPSLSLK